MDARMRPAVSMAGLPKPFREALSAFAVGMMGEPSSSLMGRVCFTRGDLRLA